MAVLQNGSKAIKITNDMARALDSYNQRRESIESYRKESASIETTIGEKLNEKSSLESSTNKADKKEVREANKKIKAIDKEISKLEQEQASLASKINDLVIKQNSANIPGVTVYSYPREVQVEEPVQAVIEEPVIETPKADTTTNEESVVMPQMGIADMINANAQARNEEVSEISEEIIPMDNTLDSNSPAVSFMSGKITEPEIKEGTEVKEIPVDDTVITDVDSIIEPVVSEPIIEEEPAAEINYAPIIEPEIEDKPIDIDALVDGNEFSDELKDFKNEDDLLTEEDARKIWNGVKSESVEPYEEDKIIEPIDEVSLEADEVHGNGEDVQEITEDVSSQVDAGDAAEIKDLVKKQINEQIPTVTPSEPVNAVEEKNKIYEKIGVVDEPMREEITDNSKRDLNDLTLFRDYADYTFTFGKQHYSKDSLTLEEIEGLSDVDGFLSEKLFESKRMNQYNKIESDDKKTRAKIHDLGEEFSNRVEEISLRYTSNVNELTKIADEAKEQAEVDRTQRIQAQKLNDSLSKTVKEQTSSIEDLTVKNSGLQSTVEEQEDTIATLQSTVDNQKDKISDLEKQNQEQAEKIKKFKEKLNSVLGIVKGVGSESEK